MCKVTVKSQNSKCFIFKNHKIPISVVVVNHKNPNCAEKYIMTDSSQGIVNEEIYFLQNAYAWQLKYEHSTTN